MIASAAEATWGVSGSAFLIAYLTAAVALAVLAVAHRRVALAGPATSRPGGLTAQQAAYLNGGEQLAGYTALAGLRAAGALGTAPDRTLAQTGAMPAGATALDAAIYNSAGRRVRARAVLDDPWVRTAAAQLRTELETAGLATTAAQRRTVRLWGAAAFALAAIGVLRLLTGSDTGLVTIYLVPVIAAVAILGGCLLATAPKRTRAGTAAVADLRSRHLYLAPASSPSYATYGPTGAATGVALYGPGTLYLMDPGFAADAGIQRQAAHSGGGSSGSSGSSCGSTSSCGSSSSSCGGGGGCGGGG